MGHWRGAMPGMKLGAGWGRRVVGGGCGWRGRCMLVVACRPSSPVHFGPFEAADKYGAGVLVAGHALAAASARVSFLIDVRGPVGRFAVFPVSSVAAFRRWRVRVMYDRVAAIDVHKDMVKVAVRVPGARQGARKTDVLEFRAFYGVLQEMGRELRRRGVTHVVMEASG